MSVGWYILGIVVIIMLINIHLRSKGYKSHYETAWDGLREASKSSIIANQHSAQIQKGVYQVGTTPKLLESKDENS